MLLRKAKSKNSLAVVCLSMGNIKSRVLENYTCYISGFVNEVPLYNQHVLPVRYSGGDYGHLHAARGGYGSRYLHCTYLFCAASLRWGSATALRQCQPGPSNTVCQWHRYIYKLTNLLYVCEFKYFIFKYQLKFIWIFKIS